MNNLGLSKNRNILIIKTLERTKKFTQSNTANTITPETSCAIPLSSPT